MAFFYSLTGYIDNNSSYVATSVVLRILQVMLHFCIEYVIIIISNYSCIHVG